MNGSIQLLRSFPCCCGTLILLLVSGCLDGDSSPSTASTGSINPKQTSGHPDQIAALNPEDRVLIVGDVPRLQMIGPESGFDFERIDDISHKRRIMETNGGGVALLDYDRNGFLDIFMTNGSRLPPDPKDHSSPSRLFRNVGKMKFQQVTEPSGVSPSGFSTGCTVGDFDNDGFEDLYVTAAGHNSFWKNNGDGTFTEVTQDTGTSVPEWSTSAAFGDLNNDGVLDLYVVNYLDESLEQPRLCPNPQSPDGYQGCSPALFDAVRDALFLGDGQGGFFNATQSSQIAEHIGKGLGVVIADFNRDGWQEIYVANDGEANFLFSRPDPGNSATVSAPLKNFTELKYDEIALQNGVALNERGYAQASMGIAAGDYDSNGSTDLYLTHFFGDTNTLYAHEKELSFVEQTRGSGLGASSRRTLGFGTLFFDFNNDGWLDLFVANGHVDNRTWLPTPEPYRMLPQIYRNEGDGTFADMSQSGVAYLESAWLGRGVAEGDLDLDGKGDLVVSHQLDRSFILKNNTATSNSSIVIQLVGRDSNRNGLGTQVTVRVNDRELYRELVGGASFQSASALEILVGIDSCREVPVEIRWPSGQTDRYDALTPGAWIAIEGLSIFPRSPDSFTVPE